MAKITTKSTAKEISDYFENPKQILAGRLANKMLKNFGKLKRQIKLSATGCVNGLNWACRLNVEGYRLSAMPIGIYLTKPHGEEKLLGSIGLNTNTVNHYVFMKDAETCKQVLVFTTVDNYVMMFEAHALSRYRERFLNDNELSFDEVADILMSRNACFNHLIGGSVYGTDFNKTILSTRCRDGIFLGYKDYDTNVIHCCTFICEDMLNDRQYYHSAESEYCKEFLEHERNLRVTPKTEPTHEFKITPVNVEVEDGKTNIRPMTVDDMRALLDEIDRDPEGYRERRRVKDLEQMREHQQRWKRKMMRKGYK